MAMKKLCGGIILLLLLVISGGIYKFIFQGTTSAGSDGRNVIHLTESERDLVLTEMRAFLNSVQKITQGVANNDLQLISEFARKAGTAAQAGVPGTLVGKLPLEFKQLGFDTHRKFEQLAMDNDDLGDSSQALIQLSNLMENCVACHAAYRIDITVK